MRRCGDAQSISVAHVGSNYGARISGVDVRSSTADELRQLAKLLFENRFLVVADQELALAEYAAFGRQWGEPVLLISRKNRSSEYPEIIVQSNSLLVPEPLRNVASHWHCDSSYETTAASVTMLLGCKAPAEGGETLFADLVSAFEGLPADERRRLSRLEVRHAVSAAKPAQDEHIVHPNDLPVELSQDTEILPAVVHPLVRVHPVTGRKALYGLGGSPFEIVGMSSTESADLIASLKQHATQERFVETHKLMPGEILVWDNFSVMHRATPIEYSDDPLKARLNYRISLKGLPTFLAA